METLTRSDSHTLPEREEQLELTPELHAELNAARKEISEGKCTVCHTKEELAAFFHRL